jgi:hypothetical protein
MTSRVRAVLTSTWWPVLLSFGALTVRLAHERACSNPYDLLPDVTSNPAWALLLAAVYVAAHVWAVCAYVMTVSVSDALLPGPAAFRAAWGSSAVKPALMAVVFAIEYAPIPVWRLLGHALGCRP